MLFTKNVNTYTDYKRNDHLGRFFDQLGKSY